MYINIYNDNSKNDSVKILYGDKILDVKTIRTLRKYFLLDVQTNKQYLSKQTYGKLFKNIERLGFKNLRKTYNNIKPILYGNIKNNSYKKIITELNVFNFGDEVFEYNRNKQPER